MNNYLKGYPYLFVRESDQTDYFCTLCDAFLKEEELQAHLFDGHQAEDCSNYFVRVIAEHADGAPKKFVHICVVCWGKLPNSAEMATHRLSCKMANGKPTAGAAAAGTASDSENIQEKSEAMDADQEVTKLVTTPDIQCYEDMEGPDTSNGTSKASSPPPPPPSLHHTLNKRGRKKQLHPQQVLTPERMKEVVNTNLIQCGLCDIVIPSNDESKHLQEWHRLTVPLDNTTCPLCCNPIHLLELVPHLTLVHNVTPPSTGHALLLWILTSNQLRKNNHHHLMNHPMSAMLLQQMLPSLKNSSPNATPPSSNATPPSHQPMPPTSSSFLQSLLNGGEPPNPIAAAAVVPRPLPPHHPAPSPVLHPSPPTPSLISAPHSAANNSPSVDINKLEHVVAKLTRKHMGLNARESYQCQVCSKWFAVPPIKHLRGHLVTFRDEQRPYINLINSNGYACLSCFHIAPSAIDITEHLSNFHHLDPHGLAGGQGQPSPASSPSKPQEPADQPVNYTRPSRPSGIPTIIADPKGVELDNAGRVKSGKVRKQCELCGQWSNIKWFFKHMSEVHNALFCRCCREYLPIHEQEEHRKWHAEPPYMGQKIRIENGQPVIIDRKERASLTPIGSLAAWGGSSGGMVVKAIDDGTSQLISRKRKGASNSTNGSGGPSQAKISNNASSTKDTLMPKETCPVCGIQITYKNLARHIKLRHKIKYKFCHKCRKFVPNDTYEDHRLTCTAVASDAELNPAPDMVASSQNGSAGEELGETHDSVDASDYLDMDGASALVINTDDNEDPNDLEDQDGKRSNTSKNKLESLLGKEFKHPRRKCGICGYMVSYSNYKRHLKNAHPSIHTEDGDDSEVRYLGHQMDEDEQDDDQDEMDEDIQPVQDQNRENYAECNICGDHIMREFLDRHMKMNHCGEEVFKNEVKMRECPVCEVKMRVEGIVKHCKLKHKVTYKWCRPCEKYVLKRQYRGHIVSPSHREVIKDAEKHSSHEEEEDEEDDLHIESEENNPVVKEETVLNETV